MPRVETVASKRRIVALLPTLTLLILAVCQTLPATATDNATVIVIGPQPANQPDSFLRTIMQLVMAVLILVLLASMLLIVSNTFSIPLL